MFKFLKEAFPDLQKPDWLPDFGGSKVEEEEIEIEVQAPSEALVTAGKGMSALSGVFGVEADLQALALNLGSYDEEEVREEIEATIQEAPVVVYTYGLSPFSTEALAILESTGCEVKNVELGGEWFLLGPKASATRVELRKMYGQGSLPHIFIGGEWIGGLATGGDGGLVGLVEREELVPKLRAAGAL
jgi:glutaredoxin-related protein